MNFKHNATRFFSKLGVASLILGALAFGCSKVAFGQPGRPLSGTAGFILEFDEAGHGQLITGGGLFPNPGVPQVGGGLLFSLPVPVTPGDVSVFNPGEASTNNPNGFSDLLTFFNQGNSSVLLYRSRMDESEPVPDPADVLGLTSPGGLSVLETGPEGNNGFVWIVGTSGGPDYTVYNGISDVPEPSTFVLGGLGLVGLFLIRYRRRVRNQCLIQHWVRQLKRPGLLN